MFLDVEWVTFVPSELPFCQRSQLCLKTVFLYRAVGGLLGRGAHTPLNVLVEKEAKPVPLNDFLYNPPSQFQAYLRPWRSQLCLKTLFVDRAIGSAFSPLFVINRSETCSIMELFWFHWISKLLAPPPRFLDLPTALQKSTLLKTVCQQQLSADFKPWRLYVVADSHKCCLKVQFRFRKPFWFNQTDCCCYCYWNALKDFYT